MADTLVLEASAFGVGVQVPPAAPTLPRNIPNYLKSWRASPSVLVPPRENLQKLRKEGG